MDSTSKNLTFDIYQGWGDEKNGPLGITIAQSTTEAIAWSDQPSAGKNSSTKAHSKFFIAHDSNFYGYAVAHSVPRYPLIA